MTETQQDWAAQVERDMRMAHLISRAEHEARVAAAVAAALREAADACERAAYDGVHPQDDMAELGCLRSRDRILSLIPDAGAALDRALREERAKTYDDAAQDVSARPLTPREWEDARKDVRQAFYTYFTAKAAAIRAHEGKA